MIAPALALERRHPRLPAISAAIDAAEGVRALLQSSVDLARSASVVSMCTFVLKKQVRLYSKSKFTWKKSVLSLLRRLAGTVPRFSVMCGTSEESLERSSDLRRRASLLCRKSRSLFSASRCATLFPSS